MNQRTRADALRTKGIGTFLPLIVNWLQICCPRRQLLLFIYISLFIRDSLASQLQLMMAKVESEQLARSLADKQRSDIERDKTMMELELKESLKLHETNISKKDIKIVTVTLNKMF